MDAREEFLGLVHSAPLEEVVRSLSTLEPDSVVEFRKQGLFLAARIGRADVVKMLLENGVNPDASDDCGTTTLMTAAERGHAPVMRLVLARGADVDESDRVGATALFYAVKAQQREAVQVLLDAGADVRRRLPTGASLLYFAKRKPFGFRLPFGLVVGGLRPTLRKTRVARLLEARLAAVVPPR